MDDIIVVSTPLAKNTIREISERRFGDMVKAVVDLERSIMAIGGELHADEEAVLLDSGSKQENLWGINIYHALPRDQWIEFDSMINIRPAKGNRSRSVQDQATQKKIVMIVNKLILD
ncbi:MAG: DUF5674 family protein [Patescibacteria group bacterium]